MYAISLIFVVWKNDLINYWMLLFDVMGILMRFAAILKATELHKSEI